MSMSAFATTILNQKYVHIKKDGQQETWPEVPRRVSKHVMRAVNAPKELTREIEKAIVERKFIPGGRYLSQAGRPYHQVQNCYAGETRVVTREGTQTLEDLYSLSDLFQTTVTLMTTEGKWTKASVEEFGVQPLLKVTLSRAGIEKELFATAGHSWRISKYTKDNGSPMHKHSVTTEQLLDGDRLWSVFGYGISRTPVSLAGVQHGLVYGDGNVPSDEFGLNTANLRLCGEKDAEFIKYFDGYSKRKIEEDTEINGLPRHYKQPVDLKSDRSYLLGWLAGYFAADGCVSKEGVATLASADRQSLQLVKDVAYILGIGIYGIRFNDRISNLTNEPSRLYSVAFMRDTLTEDFFLSSKHKERFLANPQERKASWVVKSVEKTNRVERVYCAVVPETHEFVLEDNILTGNCLLLRAEDSRESWSQLLHNGSLALMTGAGIGVDYSQVRPEGKIIRKTGGTATGPLSLMQMLNEVGRGVMAGGSRRSAIWAGLSWKHADIHKFISLKNWIPEVRSLKERNFSFPATMDGTNISVQLDDEFFKAFEDDKHPLHVHAHSVYWATVKQMLKTGEPGFSVDTGRNKNETLRNAPVSANTYVLLDSGYTKVGDVIGKDVIIWTGKRWTTTKFIRTKKNTKVIKVLMNGNREIVCDPDHEFISRDGERIKAKDLKEGVSLLTSLPDHLKISPIRLNTDYYTLGYVYGDGTFHKKYPRAEVTFCTEESKKCVDNISASMVTSINWKDGRGFIRAYFKNDELFRDRQKELFPEDLHSRSLGEKCYFIAGLFDSDGNYFKGQNRVRVASKHHGFLVGVRRLLESMGILSSISTAGISTYGNNQGYMLTINGQYVTRFSTIIPTIRLKIDKYNPYRETQIKVLGIQEAGYEDVYCCNVGVEEHSFMAEGIIISNCCEITSGDDSDICNLGSVNLARIQSLDEMKHVVEIGTAFLLAGTVYSDVPYAKVDQVRTKNRRLGLGLMGVHEWLLSRGKKYGPDDELEQYLKIYETSGESANKYAEEWELSSPVKTRAIAPNGSIGIIAETSTAIEPIFCSAYKRRYLKGSSWHYQFVIDPIAKKLVDSGVDPDSIEDAYILAEDVERRVAFQAWMQGFVDHAISSTINLPAWGSSLNNEDTVTKFGNMLIKYLPQLRGITIYPDGSRGGQPLTAVAYKDAASQLGEIFEESVDVCDLTKAGSCG